MKKIQLLVSNNLRQLFSFLALFLLFGGAFCTNSLDNGGSQSSTGAGQIEFNLKPKVLFGNGSDISEVQVITGEIPDGSNVEFSLTTSNLPGILEGCLLNKGTTIVNGEVSANYLTGLGGPAIVNVSVTITTSDGKKESRFDTLVLRGVSITPPQDTDVTTNPTDSPNSVFVPLQFQTTGIPTGTTVNFSLSRPDLGKLNPTSTTVGGSEDSGTATTEYDTINNTGGTQVITAKVILPNPADVDPSCPDVSIGDRTIQAIVTITQSVPQPTPAPSPGP